MGGRFGGAGRQGARGREGYGGWQGPGNQPRHGGRAGGGGPARRFERQEDDPPGTSRMFVAVPLPDDVREAVGRLMERVAGGPVDERMPGQPRWVRVDGLHLTLRFLGATPDSRTTVVSDAIAAAATGVEPFDVRLSGGGAFPNARQPRVMWIGITEGAGRLGELAGRIDRELQQAGWAGEQRPFAAHLTLARTDGVAGASDAVGRLIEAAQELDAHWQADRVVLYRSLLGRGPARYEALFSADLR